MSRKFGIEIEAYNIPSYRVVQLLNDSGINCIEEGYNHRRRNHWKVVYDGSLNGVNNFEVVSPVLSGEEGIEEAVKVANILKENGAKINKSCGLHVHVDAHDLSVAQYISVFFRYAHHEEKIDAFMAKHRRNNGTTYCRSIKDFVSPSKMSRVKDSNTIGAVIRGFGGNRYKKVNTYSYERHGTIEFRHHNGSVKAKEIENWIRFCVAFVEHSASLSTSVEVEVEAIRSSIQQKYKAMVELLIRRGGATIQELSNATGYAENTVKAVISNRIRSTGINVKCIRGYNSYYIPYYDVRNATRIFDILEPVAEPNPLPPRGRGRPSRARIEMEAEYSRRLERYQEYIARMTPNAARVNTIREQAFSDFENDNVFNGIPTNVVEFYANRAA